MNPVEILYRATSAGGSLLAETSKLDPMDSLSYNRGREEKFKERHYQRWKEGIDLLELFLIMNREAGEDFAQNYMRDHNVSDDHQFKAILLLHTRACQSTHEILTLIKNGFADGAYARWRNLYETAATAFFIKEKDDAGERFLDYRIIEDYHRAKTYQEYTDREELNLEKFSVKEMETLEDNRNKMIGKYNHDFDDGGRGYGWACKYFNNPHFLKIAEESGIEHLKPYYELTHKLIHSGATSATYSMGMLDLDEQGEDSELDHRLLAGPSNYGVADAAQNTAISLSQVSTALLTIDPSPVDLIQIQAFQKLIEDISKLFVETQWEIEKEASRNQ